MTFWPGGLGILKLQQVLLQQITQIPIPEKMKSGLKIMQQKSSDSLVRNLMALQ